MRLHHCNREGSSTLATLASSTAHARWSMPPCSSCLEEEANHVITVMQMSLLPCQPSHSMCSVSQVLAAVPSVCHGWNVLVNRLAVRSALGGALAELLAECGGAGEQQCPSLHVKLLCVLAYTCRQKCSDRNKKRYLTSVSISNRLSLRGTASFAPSLL